MKKQEREDLLRHGIGLQQQNKFAEAEYCYQQVLQATPKDPDANNLMGTLAVEARQYQLSVDYISKAVLALPKEPSYRNNLANSLILNGEPLKAIPHLEKALKLQADFVLAEINLAKAYRAAGRLEDAVKLFDRVLEKVPDALPAINGKGQALVDLGESDKAAELFRSVIKKKPDSVEAYVGLMDAKKFDAANTELQEIAALLEGDNLRDTARMALHHVAGKICDDIEEYDAAFAHFQRGKKLASRNYDSTGAEANASRIAGVYNAEFFGAFKDGINDDEMPVFVVGMPRSGTTLVEQILASHSGVHGAGEITDFNDITDELFNRILHEKMTGADAAVSMLSSIRQCAKLYSERLRAIAPKSSRVINKTPHNFARLGMIALMYNNAKIIHCTRDPMDTCVSCFTHLFNQVHGYNTDLTELGRYYRAYDELMRHWDEALPLPILNVNYEALVGDQEAQSRKMIEFLGLQWEEACLAFHENKRVVLTPSRWQVRQPLYATSVARWRRYAAHLGPLKAVLGDLAPDA